MVNRRCNDSGERVRRLVASVALVVVAGCGMAPRGPRAGAEPVGPAVVASIPIGERATDIAVRSDAARVYVTLRTGKVQAIDTASRQVVTDIATDGQPGAIALTPDGTRGYVMDMTAQSLFVLDTRSDQLARRLPVGTIARAILTPSVAVARDGRHAYVTNATTKDDHLLVVDTATNTIVKDQFLSIHPVGVAVSPDGATVYVAGCKLSCIDGTLLVMDAATTTVTSQVALPASPSGLALAPDGRRAYLANGRDATVGIVDLATRNVATVPVGAQPLGIVAGPRGRLVYVASFGDSRIDVIDTRTDTVLTHVAVRDAPRAIAISPDARFLYVTHTASTVLVIDLAHVVP